MKGLLSSQQSLVSGHDIDAVRLSYFKEIVFIDSASYLEK